MYFTTRAAFGVLLLIGIVGCGRSLPESSVESSSGGCRFSNFGFDYSVSTSGQLSLKKGSVTLLDGAPLVFEREDFDFFGGGGKVDIFKSLNSDVSVYVMVTYDVWNENVRDVTGVFVGRDGVEVLARTFSRPCTEQISWKSLRNKTSN